jgi:hypothetical protein
MIEVVILLLLFLFLAFCYIVYQWRNISFLTLQRIPVKEERIVRTREPASTCTVVSGLMPDDVQNITDMENLHTEKAYADRMFMMEEATAFPGVNNTVDRMMDIQKNLAGQVGKMFGAVIGKQYKELIMEKTLEMNSVFEKVRNKSAYDVTNLQAINNEIAKLFATDNHEYLQDNLNKLDDATVKQYIALNAKDYNKSNTHMNSALLIEKNISRHLAGLYTDIVSARVATPRVTAHSDNPNTVKSQRETMI